MGVQEIQFTNGIRQTYLPKLNTITKCASIGLRKWIETADSFVPVDTGDSKCIELSLYDISEVLACWSSDIVRLSNASVETVHSISSIADDKKFLAWQIVQYYYSAFYSAHATLKLCGFGLIQIDQKMITNIKKRALTLGITLPDYKAGIYCVDMSVSNAKVTFFVVNQYNDSHKGLWKRYVDYLRVLTGLCIKTGSTDSNCVRDHVSTDPAKPPLSVYAQLSDIDARAITSRIDELLDALHTWGNCNWLSSIRNLVNYNHALGVWYPYDGYSEELLSIASNEMKELYIHDPMSTVFSFPHDDELIKYAKCCQLINSINVHILFDLSKRHPDNKSFLRHGPIAFMNTHGYTIR
jgi:hypothetical protein